MLSKRKSDIQDLHRIAKTKKIYVVDNFKEFQSQQNNCLYYHDGDGYDASSSEIKKLIKNQRIQDVKNLVSDDVLHYITKNKLYI